MIKKIDHLTSASSREYIDQIYKDHENGYRFTFFIGAGLSRPAGYPLPKHLGEHYLPYCIMRVLGLAPLSESPRRDRFPRWDPRSARWPRMDEEIAERWSRPKKDAARPKLPHVRQLTRHLTQWLAQTATAKGEEKFKILYPELSRELVASALGAIQNWRTSLRFLCQVQLVGSKLELIRPDYAVQDSMFQSLLQLCDPGLGHRMVAALCTVMRCNCIVTTNFDDLIEKAFATMPLALATFEVAQPSPMPGAMVVCSQRSLIKMNGGNFSLITNETLDAEPTKDDLDNFVGYLRGLGATDDTARTAIIVTGVGGTEPRTLALFRHAAARLPLLHIYWLAFSHNEVEADKLVNDLEFHQYASDPDEAGRRLLRLGHKEHGLFLQQLFMRLTRSLPSSGVVFPGLWRLPLPPIIHRGDESTHSDLKKDIKKAIKASRMVIVLSTAAESAIRRVSAEVAGESSSSVAWLDLDQVGYPWGLLLRIIQMAARMHGTAEAPPALDFHQWNEDMDGAQRAQFISTMKHILRRYHVRLFDELIIYLNGLDELASHAPFGPKSSGNMRKHYTNKTQTLPRLWDCLHEIASDPTCGIRFVILGSLYKKPAGDKFSDCSTNGLSLEKWRAGKKVGYVLDESTPERFVEGRVQAAEQWCKKDRLRTAYLYLACAFRYSRHPVAICRVYGRYAERAKQDTKRRYEESFADSETWLGEWLKVSQNIPILREKLGGMLWMHPRIKEVLKKRVARAWLTASGLDYPYEILMMGNLLARHYGQLLLATADPLAGLELVHHVLRAIEASLIHGPADQLHGTDKIELEALALHMIQHGIIAIKLCRPLLDRRLASDFAEAALEGVDLQLKGLRKSLRRRLPQSKALDAIIERLHFMELEASMARGDVLLRSARGTSLFTWYSKVDVSEDQGARTTKTHQDPLPFVRRHESRTLKKIGALVLSRQHRSAQRQLVKVWKELAQKVCSKKHSTTMVASLIKPLVSRLNNTPCPASQMGDYLARLWLYHAWTADTPMTDAMMEHWRRYIVRACLWSTMLILNRVQALHLLTKSRNELKNRDKIDLATQIKGAIWIADFGLEILRNVDHSRDGIAAHEQVRLRGLIALCRTYLSGPPLSPESRDYLKPVMRSLNGLRDASAWVEEFPFRDAELERAVIALRNAEVRLASLWKVGQFHDLLDLIIKHKPDHPAYTPTECEGFLKDFEKLDVVGLRANAEQVLSLLDSAENTLRAYPKSVWWIWILWALKARVSAFYFNLRAGHALSFKERGSANVDALMHVPNSLRTASRGGIFSAISMQGIRDPFRIARIIRSQHRVFAAELFRHRLLQTPQTSTLEQVLQDLADGMTDALKILQTQIHGHNKNKADPNLIDYCQHIHNQAHDFVAIWAAGQKHPKRKP